MSNIKSVSYSMPQNILDEIDDERYKQNVKWGNQSGNTNPVWAAILTEEVGEVAQAVLKMQWLKEHKFGELGWCKRCGIDPDDEATWLGMDLQGPCPGQWRDNQAHLREELVQVAAVAVAWLEALDSFGRSPGIESVMSGTVVDAPRER